MAAKSLRQTDEFRDWFRRLRDERAKARIIARIRRMEFGNPGDTRSLSGGLTEMRIDYGPGYRIYFVHHSTSILLLLCGGDKRTQQRDIIRARELMEEPEE
jgi:putative addiction module killer protein